MRTKLIVPTILLVIAIALSACSGSFQFGQAATRTVNVTGNAQVIIDPDIAYVSIGVHSEAQTAKEAVANNNSLSQAVIEAIKGQGVEDKDIKTINFSVSQQEKYSPTGEDLGPMFVADNTVYVTMRDLTKVASILDASINAGANTVYGITFDVQDKEKAMSSGQDKAVADAKSQAEQLAAAAGASLGPVQSISYYSNPPTPYYFDSKAASGVGAGGASVPISPGQLTLTVTVNISYALK